MNKICINCYYYSPSTCTCCATCEEGIEHNYTCNIFNPTQDAIIFDLEDKNKKLSKELTNKTKFNCYIVFDGTGNVLQMGVKDKPNQLLWIETKSLGIGHCPTLEEAKEAVGDNYSTVLLEFVKTESIDSIIKALERVKKRMLESEEQ